ncbi:hypothetical protein STANM309S_05847 [Streptomyces tanashiensis]
MGWPWVRPDWSWAAPARCSSLSPGTSPMGATRMLAPQPLEWIWLASCQGRSPSRSRQARRQVLPGARLFSGEWYQSTNSSRTGRASRDGASTPRSMAVRMPRAKARVIWVSSVTYAFPFLTGSSISRQGPTSARIDGTSLNSVGNPSASPSASPIREPVAACLVAVRARFMRGVLPVAGGAGGGSWPRPPGRERPVSPVRR